MGWGDTGLFPDSSHVSSYLITALMSHRANLRRFLSFSEPFSVRRDNSRRETQTWIDIKGLKISHLATTIMNNSLSWPCPRDTSLEDTCHIPSLQSLNPCSSLPSADLVAVTAADMGWWTGAIIRDKQIEGEAVLTWIYTSRKAPCPSKYPSLFDLLRISSLHHCVVWADGVGAGGG